MTLKTNIGFGYMIHMFNYRLEYIGRKTIWEEGTVTKETIPKREPP